MKKQDILIIVLIGGFSAIISYFVSYHFFASPTKHTAKVEVVNKITSDFPDPKGPDYSSFFNSKALNPTQEITIGGDPNTKPLSGNR